LAKFVQKSAKISLAAEWMRTDRVERRGEDSINSGDERPMTDSVREEGEEGKQEAREQINAMRR
jgi:hypothetical protein